MAVKLVLCRHGQSDWNLKNLFTGWTDVDLTEQGVQEAIDAARTLNASGYEFDIAFTSVLTRAIRYHTGAFIIKASTIIIVTIARRTICILVLINQNSHPTTPTAAVFKGPPEFEASTIIKQRPIPKSAILRSTFRSLVDILWLPL